MRMLLLVVLGVIALVVVAWIVIGLTVKLLWFALVGLLIGALARLVLPGRQELGILMTALAGMGGSLIGAIVANVLDFGTLVQYALAIAVAAVLVVVFEGGRLRERFT
jgi:uncharacterized membrane protein YeaQ/YmgE (transglycosylase-associated protein family)